MGAFKAHAAAYRDARVDSRPLGEDLRGNRYWRLGGAAGMGAVYVEAPGEEEEEEEKGDVKDEDEDEKMDVDGEVKKEEEEEEEEVYSKLTQ